MPAIAPPGHDYHPGVIKRVMNFLFESFGISAVGETPEERKWREFREQQARRAATGEPPPRGTPAPNAPEPRGNPATGERQQGG